MKLRVQEVPGEDAVCGSIGVSPRQVWEGRLGWKGTGQMRKNLSRGRLSQAHAESLKLGGPTGCLLSPPGSFLTCERPGHVTTPSTTDDRRLSGKAPATSEMKPKAQ